MTNKPKNVTEIVDCFDDDLIDFIEHDVSCAEIEDRIRERVTALIDNMIAECTKERRTDETQMGDDHLFDDGVDTVIAILTKYKQ